MGKLSAFDGNPALLDALEGQRHAHKARDKEADGGEGKLNVTELTYNGKAELPVFANSYTEPAAPVVADEPEEVLPQTGDTLPTLLAGVAAVAVVALAVLGFAAFKLRRGKNTHRMK